MGIYDIINIHRIQSIFFEGKNNTAHTRKRMSTSYLYNDKYRDSIYNSWCEMNFSKWSELLF